MSWTMSRWKLMIPTSTERALLGDPFSSSRSHLWPKPLSPRIQNALHVRLFDGWMSSSDAESVYRTAQDGTGQAQHEHISRTAGDTRERGMCASEACISKSDLSCGCLWWCPHGRALRYGTWPLSGPSVWPFLFEGSLRRWPAVPTSSPRVLSPQPGSPPGTARPPFPSPTGPGASEIHSWREWGRR